MGSELKRRGFHGLEGQILSVGVTIIRGEWGEWEKWEWMGAMGVDGNGWEWMGMMQSIEKRLTN